MSLEKKIAHNKNSQAEGNVFFNKILNVKKI